MAWLGPAPGERHMLPPARFSGPMPWMIAIMMFLTALTAAAGLGLSGTTTRLRQGLSDRITIQVIESDAKERERQTRRVLEQLARLDGVEHVRRIEQSELADLLKPWLGESMLGEDVTLPSMIDVDLAAGARPRIVHIGEVVRSVAPAARIDDHARWMSPLDRLVRTLRWLSLALLLLMGTATSFAVVLATRAALDLHRETIDVMHMLGSTDPQIARLFQRQIAQDALAGGLVGFVVAALVVIMLSRRIASLGSELAGSITFPLWGWFVLLLLALAGVPLAMVTARWTILSGLRRML